MRNEKETVILKCGHKSGCIWMIDQAKCYAKMFGYEIVSSDYIHYTNKLNFVCSKKHRFSMTWRKFYGGKFH